MARGIEYLLQNLSIAHVYPSFFPRESISLTGMFSHKGVWCTAAKAQNRFWRLLVCSLRPPSILFSLCLVRLLPTISAYPNRSDACQHERFCDFFLRCSGYTLELRGELEIKGAYFFRLNPIYIHKYIVVDLTHPDIIRICTRTGHKTRLCPTILPF